MKLRKLANNPQNNILIKVFLSAGLIAALLLNCVSTFSIIDTNDKIPFDDNIRKGVLENGLSYYIRENNKPENRIILRLVVDAGSILENEDQLGLAHFAEHMAFNGTEQFAEHEIIKFMESIGMRFGPDINAYTSFDETVYKLNLPADNPELVKTAFEILKEWAFHVSFDKEAIDKERYIIKEEWRYGRGAQARMRDQYFPILFTGSRYADRLPIGDMDIVMNFEYDTLRNFYSDWYRPELMGVIVVGDIDAVEIEEMIFDKFSPYENQKNALSRKEYGVPDHDATLAVVVTDPEATSTKIEIIHKHDPQNITSRLEYRKYLKTSLFSTMLNNRLRQITRSTDSPFIHSYSGFSNIVRPKGAYVLGATIHESKIEEGIIELMQESERALYYGFSNKEFERAKASILRKYQTAFNERENTESSLLAAELVRHYLHGEVVPGIEYEWNLVNELIPEITIEEVIEQGRYLRSAKNRVIIVTGPEKENLVYPRPEQLKIALHTGLKKKVGPWQEEDYVEDLMESFPRPGIVDMEEYDPDVEFYTWILSNGARVLFKPTDFKEDEVLFTAYQEGGSFLLDDEDYPAALFTTGMVMQGGVGNHSLDSLESYLAGKKVSIGPYISQYHHGFRGHGAPEDLEILLQLMHLYMTKPRYDNTAFTSYLNRVKGMIINRLSRPENIFYDRVQEILYNYHSRVKPITPELVDSIDPEQTFKLFETFFSNAQDFVFIFTGNVDPDYLKEMTELYIASLPETGESPKPQDQGLRFYQGTLYEEVKVGLEPRSTVQLIITGDYNWSLKENNKLVSLRDLLRIKLREEVREQAGGTYGIGVGALITKFPVEQYAIPIHFSCDPDRVEELIDIVKQTLGAVKEGDIDEDYVKRVTEARLRELEEQKKQNEFWLSLLRDIDMYDLEPKAVLAREERIKALTVDKIAAGAARYIDFDSFLQLVHLPAE